MTGIRVVEGLFAPVVRPGRGLWHKIERARALHAQRRELARLDARRLRDIGLTDDEAGAEARRPFWDAPAHWYLND